MQVTKLTGFKALPVGLLTLLAISLLLAACGDNTATATPPTTAAATTAAATTVAATTAAVTTASATTAPAATTASAATTAAATTSTTTTTAAASTTSAAATTASGVTTPAATTASASTASGTPKVNLQNTTALIGTTITVAGEGFPANTWLTIQFGPNDTTRSVASLALSGADGKFSAPLILSAYGDGSAITPGKNTILVSTQDGKVTSTTSLTLTAPATTATPKQ